METRLRELRLENGLRQKDVAEKIGVCTASYGFYENWINKPDPETLVKLANLYNVSIDYLLGLTDDFGERTAAPSVDTYTAEEKQVIQDYRKLTRGMREILRTTLNAMINDTSEDKV